MNLATTNRTVRWFIDRDNSLYISIIKSLFCSFSLVTGPLTKQLTPIDEYLTFRDFNNVVFFVSFVLVDTENCSPPYGGPPYLPKLTIT